MTVRQLWVQDAEYQAADDRLLLAALLPTGTRGPLGTAVGLRKVDDLVLTMTGGFAGTVSRGAAFIDFGPGIYLLVNDDPEPVTFGPADPTNARIDIVVAQVYDVEVGGPAAEPSIRTIPGVASATPVAPTLPAGALLLNTLRYDAGATAPINTRNAGPLVPLPFPAGYRESTGSALQSIVSGTWALLTTPTQGASGGTGITGDATSISVNAPGQYDVELQYTISQSNAGRRGVGWSFATGTPPSGFAQAVFSGNSTSPTFRTNVNVTAPTGTRICMWAFQDTGGGLDVTTRRMYVRRTA